jgi:hypothetical protein
LKERINQARRRERKEMRVEKRRCDEGGREGGEMITRSVLL